MTNHLPGPYQQFIAQHPELGKAHDVIASLVNVTGKLDAAQLALIKIGICVGAGLESALKSHVRRAVEAQVSKGDIEQAILQGMSTVGFPRTVAAWTWAMKQLQSTTTE